MMKKDIAPHLACEKYTLPNGLQVVLQQDHSDPVVAVAIHYHVGSAREKAGRTGFAHFFEHMLFQRSEHLPRNVFFNRISALGGSFNGSTDSDGTRYHEIVPRDALEKVLWMESDRMGFFINTVTQGGLEREVDVVSNEKRQNYDTAPYGQLLPVMSRYAYPEGHPYSWTTIGELADLRAATVEDVKEFYRAYYKPSNATLAIAGDFDPATAKALVERYFSEIPAGDPVPAMGVRPAPMERTVRVFHEDPYASMPMLVLAFPAPERYHPDSYAMQMLGSVLAEGKHSPMYRVLVEERGLSPETEMWYWDRELAGQMVMIIPAFEGVDLNDVEAGVREAFAMLETEGFDEGLMEGYKAVTEVAFCNQMGGVMRRALQMAEENTYGGDPMRGFDEMERYKAVTREQVTEVFRKYILGQTHLQVSLVPAGSPGLAVKGSERAVVTEEKLSEQELQSEEGALEDEGYPRTPSRIDRSQEPALMANTPELNTPDIWKEAAAGSFTLWGATNDEMPVVRFSLTLKGGMLRDPQDKPGVASLYAQVLPAGTTGKTPGQLEDEFKRLGADLRCEAGTEDMEISGTCLSRHLGATMNLLAEVLTCPRFDAAELEKARQSTLANIAMQSDDPASIAGVAMRRVLYGGSILANQVTGTAESVAAVTMDDLRAYHACTSPRVADLHLAGDVTLLQAREALAGLRQAWHGGDVAPVADPGGADPSAEGRLYFIDQPGAQQSYILAVCPAMAQSDADYYPAVIANHRLGEGSHGRLFDELRLKRGYTYGAYSAFRCGSHVSRFMLYTQVQGTRTRESLDVIRELLCRYAADYTAEDLSLTRRSILRANAGAYETTGALVGMLCSMSAYGLPDDFVKQREKVLRQIGVDDVRRIAARWIDPGRMTYIVVGDAATQLDGLALCGLGSPVLLDKRGCPIRK